MAAPFYVVDPSGDVSGMSSLEEAVRFVEPYDVSGSYVFDQSGQRYRLKVTRQRIRFLGLFPIDVDKVIVDGASTDESGTLIQLMAEFAKRLGVSKVEQLSLSEILSAIEQKAGQNRR